MSTAASPKLERKTDLSDVLTDAVRARQTQKATQAGKQQQEAEDARFANISANAFYQVMFSEENKPEQKREAVTKLLTFEGTKEENRERIKEFELFKEYLQSQREEMAQEIIRLTDTGTFAELKSVYDELNRSLIDFDDKMKPLTDIIDAVYTLRTNGLTLEAFQEILRDRRREEELVRKKNEKRSEFAVAGIAGPRPQFRDCGAQGEARLLRPWRRHPGRARGDRAQERWTWSGSGTAWSPWATRSPTSTSRRRPRASSANMPSRSRSCASCSTSAPKSTRSARRSWSIRRSASSTPPSRASARCASIWAR